MFSNSGPMWVPWGHFTSDLFWCSPLCLAAIPPLKASSVVVANVNVLTGQRAPCEQPFRAAVTFEQHLLSDKLGDRMKEVIDTFPVEAENTEQPLGRGSVCCAFSGLAAPVGGEGADPQSGQGSHGPCRVLMLECFPKPLAPAFPGQGNRPRQTSC